MTDRRVAIVGIGQTDFSKDSGRSELQLAVEASLAAIGDAGLRPTDIDGTVSFTLDSNDELALAKGLGLTGLPWASRTPFGGGGSILTVRHAVAAITAGISQYVLIYRAFNERSGHRFGTETRQVAKPGQNWRLPFGVNTPARVYSLQYQRYMYDYGVTNADFGRYSVVARRHAATNPDAWFYQRPITLDDHQASRWIVEGVLRLLDCCQESDGAVALVLTSAERAKDLPHTPVIVEGIVGENPIGYADIMPDYLDAHAPTPQSAAKLWNELGCDPRDVQVATIYENFSPIVLMQLELHGFCPAGEAAAFIAGGGIDLDGPVPVNPHGGLLGEAYIHGMNNITEAVRQVRHTAVNQVPDVHKALVVSRHSMILSRP